jgi:tricorn protease interacting factor F2/3
MNTIHPNHYQITLYPNLSSFSFSGSVIIDFDAAERIDQITLNILELAIWQCQISRDGQYRDCRFSVDPEKEQLWINLPEPVDEHIRLKITYEGKINDQMAGFYRSRYINDDGTETHIAVTQFQESDARRAFPCVDHPFEKATFEIEMVIDEHLSAISNDIVREEKRIGDQKKSIRFRQTPRMSTYLVFWGIGTFDRIIDTVDTRVAVATLPGKTAYGVFGVTIGRKALRFCEDFFKVPYPLPKVDLIAVPDFAFGAMENWGAITFRENLLLHYPESTSKAGEQRICEVVAHETVHQWFGNLVTPLDWKYLWLNESFATYFSYRVVDAYHPEMEIWGQFILGHTNRAMSRDALIDTQPIEISGGDHVVINASTAPIIYSKGGSILRQIEGYLGEKKFQNGLHHYLTHHAYQCTSSKDLWASFEAISDKPITTLMKNWIEQPGYPVIEVKKQGKDLILTQKRFTYLPNESSQTWIIPISIRFFSKDGNSRKIEMLMENPVARIPLEPDVTAWKINDGHTGFYHVAYHDFDNLDSLGNIVSKMAIIPEDRWGLQNDLFSMVRSNRVSISQYLKFLENYEMEDAFLPLSGIAENLYLSFNIMDDYGKKEISDFGRKFFGKILERIGLKPIDKEPVSISVLREQVIWHAVIYGHENSRNFAVNQFLRLVDGKEVHPDIQKCVFQVGALVKGKEAFTWMKKRFYESESEHERMNLLAGFACFSTFDLIQESLRFTLDQVPSRNKYIPIAAMGSNWFAIPLLWKWYKDHIKELETMHPLHYERVITGIIPTAGMEDPADVHGFFTNYLKQKDLAGDAIKLAMEKLQVNLQMRNAI